MYSVRSARECAVLAGEDVTVVDDTGGLGGPMEDMFGCVVVVGVVDGRDGSVERCEQPEGPRPGIVCMARALFRVGIL